MNADIVPIKALYFETGSKRLEPGEKHSGFFGSNGRISSHLDNIRLKLSTHAYFKVLFHSIW